MSDEQMDERKPPAEHVEPLPVEGQPSNEARWLSGQPGDAARSAESPWAQSAEYPSVPDGPWRGEQYWAPPPVGFSPGAPAPVGPPPRSSRHRLVLIGSVAAAAAVAVTVSGIAIAGTRSNSSASRQTAVTAPNSGVDPFSQNGQSGSGSVPRYGWGNGFGGDGSSGDDGSGGTGSGGTGSGGTGSGGTGSGGTGSGGTVTATAAQQIGVVDVDTVLDFGNGRASGTGILLTSSGEILTNNHVAEGATAISVTVVSTGKTYTASVVGTDPTDDVAVLQLKDASGLATAKLGDSAGVKVGDAVTAVGNAGGAGGTPSSASGSVIALGQSITASDSNGSNAERLTDMIQIDAAIQAGDSGGPLYNAGGSVIGIDTAASSSRASGSVVGFAIPIAKALSIGQQIESGQETSKIHIGLPAFLGVQLQADDTVGAALLGGVVDGTAAAKAGLRAGDTITSVNGSTVTSSTSLSALMNKYQPGQQIKLGWLDTAGQVRSATVTLGSGPAD